MLAYLVEPNEIFIGPRVGQGNYPFQSLRPHLNSSHTGNSCEVYQGVCKSKEVAVKVMRIDADLEATHLRELQREIAVLMQLK